MQKTTRRRFLKQAAAASAVFPLFTIAGTKSSGKVLGANEVVRVGQRPTLSLVTVPDGHGGSRTA